MHQNKKELLLDLRGPLGGLGAEIPPNSVDLLVQNSKIQLSTQKNFNTSTALPRPCGLESKIQIQNSSSHSDVRHKIFILMIFFFKTSPAHA
jgi:hypothetical protein